MNASLFYIPAGFVLLFVIGLNILKSRRQNAERKDQPLPPPRAFNSTLGKYFVEWYSPTIFTVYIDVSSNWPTRLSFALPVNDKAEPTLDKIKTSLTKLDSMGVSFVDIATDSDWIAAFKYKNKISDSECLKISSKIAEILFDIKNFTKSSKI